MSATAKTIFAYGVYSLILGLALLFTQAQTLKALHFLHTDQHWVYVLAALLVSMGYFYISSARAENKHFFSMSVFARFWFFVVCGVLVLTELAPIPLMAFGAIDAFTAIWTYATNRKMLT